MRDTLGRFGLRARFSNASSRLIEDRVGVLSYALARGNCCRSGATAAYEHNILVVVPPGNRNKQVLPGCGGRFGGELFLGTSVATNRKAAVGGAATQGGVKKETGNRR